MVAARRTREQIQKLDRKLLDDNEFANREKAQQDLAALGSVAAPALRRTLEGKVSAEMQTRIKRLLENAKNPDASADRLREMRALEVLEQSATPTALEVLKSLAAGEA